MSKNMKRDKEINEYTRVVFCEKTDALLWLAHRSDISKRLTETR